MEIVWDASWGGDARSGADAMWGRETMAELAHNGAVNGTRLDTEIGYGLPLGNRFVGTPRAGVSTSEYGRDYRLGYGMQVLEQGKLNLQLETTDWGTACRCSSRGS